MTAAPDPLSDLDLKIIEDPCALLDHAWELEPWGRYAERTAALDALEQLLERPDAPTAPAGRHWRLELAAERSIDEGRTRRIESARELAEQTIREANPAHEIARSRARLGLGQALAWVGTDDATRQAHQAFAEAAAGFAALGRRDWRGSALMRRGYSACYQYGDLLGAEALIAEGLESFEPGSSRRASALGSFADVLIDLGELDRAEAALDEADRIAEKEGDEKAHSDVSWGRARIYARRGDSRTTERLLRETERVAEEMDWFKTHIGVYFLLEAAEMLDLLGLPHEAHSYFARARERAGAPDEEVMHTAAVLRARSGDPLLALAELQQLARGEWLEKRLIWRHTLLTAWATFRAGGSGVGELTARAVEQATACGGVRVIQAGEPELIAALGPLAQRSGSAAAREIVLAGRELIVRLFGELQVVTADGETVELPAGMPAKLVALLALNKHGMPVDRVLDSFFPDADPGAGRQRLRQVLKRLRAAAGEIILRDGDALRLVPAWVDAREFLLAANRVRGATGARAMQLAYLALALHDGPLLPSEPYEPWAEDARARISYRRLDLLDRIAADAAERGSHQEAITALESALEETPDDERRQAALAGQLRAARQLGAAIDAVTSRP